jgi:phosphatidylinositol 4-kinase
MIEKNALKEFLLYLNKDYFPSNLYNPMHYSNIKENLLKIDEKYSYPINTKERCPCHILFEFSNEENKNLSNKNLKFDNNSIKSKNTISSEEKSLFNLSEINTLPKKYLNDETSSSIYIPKVSSQFSLFVPNKNEKNTNNGGWLSCFNPNYKNNDEKEFEFEVNSTQNQKITISNSSIFGKYKFNQIQSLILDNSKYKNNLNYKNRYIYSSIIKGGDELRQDYFISLSLYLFNDIFKKKNILDINLFPFQVISNGSGGIIQTIINSTSLSKINQINFDGIDFSYLESTSSFDDKYISNLKKYFTINFSHGIEYETAIKNFISSLVGYSLICYFFDVKDRNNGNILIDDKGNMIHIDFGFLLNKSPGNIKFEKAPFKLSKDFIDLLGGIQSKYFFTFQELFYKGFKAIRENYDTIILFVELYCDLFNDLFSFYDKNVILKNLKEKFLLYTKNDDELNNKCNEIILNSIDNWRTKAYDEFQKYCVGIN